VNADNLESCWLRSERPDVAQAREKWKADQASLDVGRLAFIDETGTNTEMVRTRGRCHRSRRLIGKAPWGHWNTTTFVASLRRKRYGWQAVSSSKAIAWS
jgi:putative transposase